MGITKQGVKAGFRQGGGDQSQDPERRAADHRFHDSGDAVGQIGDQRLGALVGVAHGDAQTNGPRQNTDIVGIHQRLHRVGYHVEQQGLQHFGDAARWRDLGRIGYQMQIGGEEEAGNHRDHGRREGAKQIEQQNGSHVGLLTLLVTNDGSHDQYKYQQRRHRFQCAHKQAAKQTCRFGPLGGKHSQQDTENQTNQDLADQTGAIDQPKEGVLLCHQKSP